MNFYQKFVILQVHRLMKRSSHNKPARGLIMISNRRWLVTSPNRNTCKDLGNKEVRQINHISPLEMLKQT
jgi:hypothetical protein